jgi:hypothetical protein
VFGIGVAHVECAPQAGDGDAAGRGFAAEPLGETGGDLVGHVGQSGTVHTHLDAGKLVGLGFVEALFERPGGVGGGEKNADLRQGGIGGWRILRAGGASRGECGQCEKIAPAARGRRWRVVLHAFLPEKSSRTALLKTLSWRLSPRVTAHPLELQFEDRTRTQSHVACRVWATERLRHCLQSTN